MCKRCKNGENLDNVGTDKDFYKKEEI